MAVIDECIGYAGCRNPAGASGNERDAMTAFPWCSLCSGEDSVGLMAESLHVRRPPHRSAVAEENHQRVSSRPQELDRLRGRAALCNRHKIIAIRARSAFADKLFGSKPRHVRFEHRIVQEQRLAPPDAACSLRILTVSSFVWIELNGLRMSVLQRRRIG